MIRAVLIDDEPLARMLLREYLQAFPEITVAAECNDGFEGLKAIQQLQPDLVFLDIQMPKINGFEMLELLPAVPPVIFTTAFDEYALKAFDAHAVDYLLKPFSEERFNKAVQRFLDQSSLQARATESLLGSAPLLPSQSDRVVVKTGGRIKIIPVPSIHYLEGADDYVKVITAEGSFLKNKTLAFFESTLPPQQFVRTHRSFMVQVQEITRIDPYEKESHLAILRSGARVPVSKAGYARLRTVLGL